MGIRERIGKAILPAGTTVRTEQEIAAQVPASGVTAEPLDRRPQDYLVPFAPGRPLLPALINTPRDDGRAAPRRSEFPVAWNLQVTEQRVVPFRLLRDIADGSDIVRKCVEVVKSSLAGLDWDIALSPDATERIMSEPTTVGHTAATREARKSLMPDIIRARDFWKMPDRINGLAFPEWVAMAVEEMLVIDALTIYPNRTLDNKSLHSLEILDGATIKPLLDYRGGRPVPPYPAYQQILWGFPRGEFTASADSDGEFTADDIIYCPRTRRPFTPYGFSAVERALPMIDIYMKRLQWLRTEFTDGITPAVFMETDATYGGNPELLKAYERVFNDDLAGKTEQRHRARMLPEGMHPLFPPGMDQKYKPDYDEYIVKQICGHFGIMPTQIGFSPKGGLGGAGVQKGESANQEMFSMKPMIMWLTDLLNQLSYRFLNMPRDLTFIFNFENTALEESAAKRRMEQLQSGQMTINESRAELGLPLFTFPEADMPFVLSTLVPAGSVEEILDLEGSETGDGAHAPVTEGVDGNPDIAATLQNPRNDSLERAVNPTVIELAAFAKWTKGARKREFMFEFLESHQGKALNALAKHDPAAARELAAALKSSSTSVAVGSFVSWGSSGGKARGKVERVVRDGKIKVPGSSFEITGTDENPAVLIRVYREGKDGWAATDTVVGHRAGTLTGIEALKADDSFTPPEGAQSAAKRALKWIEEGNAGSGFTDTGRKRAADLAAGRSVSAETVGRMRSFFARHEVDKKAEGFNSGEEGFPSPGRVAWDAWGGDAGKSWVDSLNTDKGLKASDARGRDFAPEGADNRRRDQSWP